MIRADVLGYVSWAYNYCLGHCSPQVLCKVILLASILYPFLNLYPFISLSFVSFPCMLIPLSQKWGVHFSLLFAVVLGVVICSIQWSMGIGVRALFLSLDIERPHVLPLLLLYPWHLPEKNFAWISVWAPEWTHESGLPQVGSCQRLQHKVG